MTPPIRPESTNPRINRLREVVAFYKGEGATGVEIQELIAKRHPELVATAEGERRAMPRTAGEEIGGGIRTAYQGLTGNWGDEIIGRFRSISPNETYAEAVADERQSVSDFREANPKMSMGLELAGGLTSAIPLASAAVAGTGGTLLARLAATGAGGGAIAGAGAGETATGRVAGGVLGGAAGGLLGALVPAVAKSRFGDFVARQFQRAGASGQPLMEEVFENGAESVARRTSAAQAASTAGANAAMPDVPNTSVAAQRAAARALGIPETGDIANPMAHLATARAQGLGDDVLAYNLGEESAPRALRAATNQPNSNAGQIVNERLARQGGALGEAVPRDVEAITTGGVQHGPGITPPAIRLQQMLEEAQAKAGPLYDEARALGDIFPERAARQQALAAGEEAAEATPFDAFLDSPLGRRALAKAKQYPQFANLPDTDMRVLDQVYKEMGGLADEAAAQGNRENALMIRRATDSFREVLSERAPVYGRAVATYRGEAAPRQAFQEGAEQFRTSKPGEIELAFRGDDEAMQEARRLGMSSSMQQAARGRGSNADLGEFSQFRDVARSLVGTPEQRERIIEGFGRERYEQLMARLMPKIRAAAQNAAARGNSTTTKQLLDALAFGDDAMLDMVSQLAAPGQGGMTQRLWNLTGGKALQAGDRAYRLGVGKVAGETADLLTTRGADANQTLLEMLQKRARDDASRGGQVLGATAAVQRTALTPEQR